MFITWAYGGKPVSGPDDLLNHYKEKEFKSPLRSTVPLLAYWWTPEQRAREFSKALGFSLSEAVGLDFEHKVPIQRGKGPPSQTDLRLTCGSASVVIEAKRTESREEDVTAWLREGSRKNREKVLEGWLGLIKRCRAKKLAAGDVAEVPYQMIHRASSACYSNAENRWLVYQVFGLSPERRAMYLGDLRALKTLLGVGSCLRICLAECSIWLTDRQAELEQMWELGDRDLSESVRAGLKDGDLFDVQLKQVIAI